MTNNYVTLLYVIIIIHTYRGPRCNNTTSQSISNNQLSVNFNCNWHFKLETVEQIVMTYTFIKKAFKSENYAFIMVVMKMPSLDANLI